MRTTPSLGSAKIEQEAPRDREEPRAERTVAQEPVQGPEGAYERILHDLLNVPMRANRPSKPRDGACVPLDEKRRGTLVPSLPSRDEVEVCLFIGIPGVVSHAIRQVGRRETLGVKGGRSGRYRSIR